MPVPTRLSRHSHQLQLQLDKKKKPNKLTTALECISSRAIISITWVSECCDVFQCTNISYGFWYSHAKMPYNDINTCTKLQLLLGEGSSAFLEGKYEPFSRYLAMGDTWWSAIPPSCSPTPTRPTLPKVASAVLKPCLTGVCFF